MAERSVILELHDAAPNTWGDYRTFIHAVDRLGVPITWLVVPDFHHGAPLEAHPQFCAALDGRLAHGDELVLHGYLHCDDSPPPRSLHDWFMRRVFTHEGEFYRLSEAEAERRLDAGTRLFERHGWPLHGFVAPAWLLGDGARRVLARAGLDYTADPQHFYRLPDFRPVPAPALVWSARAAWRRGLSRLFCETRRVQGRQALALRLALHPEDMRHPGAQAYWLTTLERLLDDGRRPETAYAWLQRQVGQAAVA